MQQPIFTREQVVFWICRFRKLDVNKHEERRRLIDSFVNSVTVFDDYILITFNYKDGTKISLFLISEVRIYHWSVDHREGRVANLTTVCVKISVEVLLP